MREITIAGYRISLPRNRLIRIALGCLLILGGLLGFLPVLGFWMVPVGLIVLSADIALIRRLRRRAEVKYGRWRQRRGKA